MGDHLHGHLPDDHPLAPAARLAEFRWPVRAFVNYRRDDLWEADCRRLPRALARLRRGARAFAETRIRPLSAELDLLGHWSPQERPPAIDHLLAEAGRAGWLTYVLPRPVGSMPWSAARYPLVWQVSLVIEEFAWACGGLMLLLSAHHLGVMPLLLSGRLKDLRRHLLPIYRGCRRGDWRLMAFAITEPGAGSDVEDGHGAASARPGLVARRVEGGWRLCGSKCYISGGDLADRLTVFAAIEGRGLDSWTCFVVPADSAGFRVSRTELKMGMRASGAAQLEFDEVFVPNDNVVGKVGQGWTLNRAVLNASRLPVAAMGVGLARAATECAIEFARSYRLGPRALVDYQDVQMELAEMVAETRAMRSLLWQEARHARAPRQLHSALVKFHATDRAQQVIERAMALLGDHGGRHELTIERIFRDVRLTRIFEGTNDINRLALIEDWQHALMPADRPSHSGV